MLTRSRVAAALTAILTPLITVGTAWLATHMDLHLDPTAVATTAGLAGASVLAAGIKWLHGNAEFEKLEATAAKLTETQPPTPPAP